MTANLQWSNGRTSRSSRRIYFSALTPIFSRSPSAPPPFPDPSPFRYAHITPRAVVGFMYVPSIVLSWRSPDLLFCIASSIVLSCVVMGMGISLLHAGRLPIDQYQYTNIYDGPVNNWSQPQPQPNHPESPIQRSPALCLSWISH